MHFAIAASVLASLTHLYGYWIYNQGVYSGKIKPNATSWGLWALGSGIACWSYLELVGDVAKGILPLTCALVCIGTFVFALFKGKFERPEGRDVLIAVLDVAVIVFWLFTESEVATNVLMQIDVAISFAPMIRDVWKDPRSENPKPWFVWCVAYALFIAAVILSWEKWWDLMYPVNYLVLHLVVGLTARFRTVKP